MPKNGKAPQPNPMLCDEVSVILVDVVAADTLGVVAAAHLTERRGGGSACGVAKVLRRRNLSIAEQRVAPSTRPSQSIDSTLSF